VSGSATFLLILGLLVLVGVLLEELGRRSYMRRVNDACRDWYERELHKRAGDE
jgi:hypothetical protein